MTTIVRVILAGVGVILLFFAVLDGFHRAVAEVAGVAIADHALRFCPNWLIGLTTGAYAVSLAWWSWGSSKR